MTEQELFEISKRSGFITEPGVVSAAPYQVIHHTSKKFEYDVEYTAQIQPDFEPPFTPDPEGNWILVHFKDIEENGEEHTEVSFDSAGAGFSLSNFEAEKQYRPNEKEEHPECFPTIYYTLNSDEIEEFSGEYGPKLRESALHLFGFVLPRDEDKGNWYLSLGVENGEFTGEVTYNQQQL